MAIAEHESTVGRLRPSRPRRLIAAALAAGAALTASGCASVYKSNLRSHETTMAGRYGIDYGAVIQVLGTVINKEGEPVSKEGCLVGTPYASDVVTVALDKTFITVTPIEQSLEPLLFHRTFSAKLPLQPANEYTEELLESHNCSLVN